MVMVMVDGERPVVGVQAALILRVYKNGRICYGSCLAVRSISGEQLDAYVPCQLVVSFELSLIIPLCLYVISQTLELFVRKSLARQN
jgi:hypothetical protein